jgi:hypothetical protein
MESASPSVYAVVSGCAKTLAPGKSCKVELTCTPPDTNSHPGTLSVFDNVVGAPQSVPLSCTGKAPKK